ncbi:hypothetical protein WDU94_009092, partial [Cyamophila willieti]
SHLQLIFRKVADVRREKELAERRKHEPQLDQNQDQLVRKIFSKFRRDRAAQSQAPAATPETTAADVEKGVTGASSTELVPKPPAIKSSSHSERGEMSCPVLVTKPKPPGSRSAKWGRLLGSSSVESGSETATSKFPPGAPKESSVLRLPTGGTNGSGNKIFPKLQKVTATSSGPLHSPSGLRREKTIDESIEAEEATPKPESGLVVYQPKSTSPDKYKEIITNIMDFKVDVKLEVQRLNQKIARMEELLGEIVNRLPTSQPLVISQSSQDSEADRPLKPILRTNSFGSITASTSRELHPPVVSLAPRKRRSKSRSKAVAPTAPPKTPPAPPEPEASEASTSQPAADPSDETKRPFYVKPKDVS